MKCRDCEHWGWGDDEGTPVWGWCWIRTSCPDPDIERTCPAFSPKAPDIFTALSTLQAENEKLRAELERKNEALDFARTKDAEIVRLGTELERVKRENNALWTYIEIVDREYRRYMDRGYIDRLDELKKVWKRGQKED